MTKTLNLLLAALLIISTTACTSLRSHEMAGSELDLPTAINASHESGQPLTLTTQSGDRLNLHHPEQRGDRICGRLNRDEAQERCVSSTDIVTASFARQETDTGQTLGVVALIVLAIGTIAVIDFSDDVSDAITGALRE